MFVSDSDIQALPAGHAFFAVGQAGDAMYVVLEGNVNISLRGRTLENVGPGGVFGEMALIDHRERSADVIAKTAADVAVIDDRRCVRFMGPRSVVRRSLPRWHRAES